MDNEEEIEFGGKLLKWLEHIHYPMCFAIRWKLVKNRKGVYDLVGSFPYWMPELGDIYYVVNGTNNFYQYVTFPSIMVKNDDSVAEYFFSTYNGKKISVQSLDGISQVKVPDMLELEVYLSSRK